ncbi:DUF4062 domain-containing protein [Myxococcus eversor]|uniref:DUF4062 domain-containing protein n=1 Tax=Myxococcus eversor TaxID=2709661 RepID=UPI0013CF632E|nr:DUF4062 domain-containing protein [Myxococcus eversor]
MRRKLLVFISSTFKDLRDERQAAVEAVLEAGHIPAGMELFTAGSTSQLEAIKKWIDDSDAFLLILGGRYGTIEPKSKKSYTELEYQRAIEKGLPHFAVVLGEAALNNKVAQLKADALEQEHPGHLKKFKSSVMKKMCKIANDRNEIKLAIHMSLKEITEGNPKRGWVPATETPDAADTITELKALVAENRDLRKQVASLEAKVANTPKPEDKSAEFLRVFEALSKLEFDLNGETISIATAVLRYRNHIITGINNSTGTDQAMRTLYFQVIPTLKLYGFVEDYTRPGIKYDIQRASQEGRKFLAWIHELEVSVAPGREQMADNTSTSPPTDKSASTTSTNKA